MNIALKSGHLIAALGRERAQEVVPEIRHRHETQRVRLNITDVSTEEVDKIAKVASLENKALSRRILAWRELRAEPDLHPIRNALQMETALIAFVMKSPHKLLFRRGEDGQMLPYFVKRIVWHKLRREKHRGGEIYIYPAHTDMELVAFKDESSTSLTVKFEDRHPLYGGGDFNGGSVTDLLEAEELFPEKEDTYKRYEAELARFHTLLTKTGQQFNAWGRCYGTSSDDWDWTRSSKKKKGRGGSGLRSFTKDGQPSRVVIDINGDEPPDEENDDAVAEGTTEYDFWPKHDKLAGKSEDEIALVKAGHHKAEEKLEKAVNSKDEDELELEDDSDEDAGDDDSEDTEVILPVHPYLQVFDFGTESFVTCHINCLEDYKFAVGIEKKLILPAELKKLITTLIATSAVVREDIVAGKTGGVIVMSTGEPGVGKTLTAEIFAEQMQIPIYMVQCSQLGITSDKLEAELILVLKRAMRWNALLLLDEADVYTRARGDDISQNAIVGVFLRLLERFRGIMFMTSNRATAIDDAILSRCIAHIRYELPSVENSKLIWEVLAENYKIDLFPQEIEKLAKDFPLISGRNIKTLLKLATSVSQKKEWKKGEFSELIHEVAPFVDFPKAHYAALEQRTKEGKK
jgi:hypothetical protein